MGRYGELDVEVLQDLLWAFSYISSIEENGNNNNNNNGGIDNEEGNFTNPIDDICNSGCLYLFIGVLRDLQNEARVCHPTIRTIGNIVTSSQDRHTQHVIDAGFLQVANVYANHDRLAMRKESFWLLSNIAAGPPGQIEAILEQHQLMQTVINRAKVDPFQVKKEAV